MEIVDIELVPGEVLVILLEDIAKPSVVVVDGLVLHLHFLLDIHDFFLALVGAVVHVLLADQGHL